MNLTLHERVAEMDRQYPDLQHPFWADLIHELDQALLEAERNVDEAKMWRDNATAGWQRAEEERDRAEGLMDMWRVAMEKARSERKR